MKKRRLATGALSIALALTMVSTTAFAASVEFTDVPSSHWAHTSVIEMAEKGVVAGVGNNLFAPDTTVSYAQFATMIVRSFYDDQLVNGGDKWYSSFMTTAETAGILEGTKVLGNDSLVEAGINRYEMAQVMYNVLQDQLGEIAIDFDTTAIADWASIPDNYKDAVSLCYHYGTLSGTDGKGTFSGTTMMTRAQAAVVMDRLLEVCSGGAPSTPVTPEKPAGSTTITTLIPGEVLGKGAVEVEGGFFFDSSTVATECSRLEFRTENYTTLTFTVKAIDKDVQVSVSHDLKGLPITDPNKFYREVLGVVPAGQSKDFTVDCSNDATMGVWLGDNDFAGAVTDFSDLFVECYLLDITLS